MFVRRVTVNTCLYVLPKQDYVHVCASCARVNMCMYLRRVRVNMRMYVRRVSVNMCVYVKGY